MRHVNGVYTQRFNREHKKEGQLFRGRYKAVLVDEESYLLEVLRYIHRNPLKAGIVKSLDDFLWSSHKGYLSKAKKWSWLEKETLLTQLTQVKSRQKSAYLDFVSLDDSEEIEKFYSMKNMLSILGSTAFKNDIREKFSGLVNRQEVPESKVLALDAERAITSVCAHYKIFKEQYFCYPKKGQRTFQEILLFTSSASSAVKPCQVSVMNLELLTIVL